MTLLELHADMEQLTFQMKRIADAIESLLPPATMPVSEKRKAELHQITPRGRWEAEKEDRKWRQISDVEAAIMPRK